MVKFKKSKLNCPACNNDQWQKYLKVGKYNLEECLACGLVRLKHNFSNKQVLDFYDYKYYFSNDPQSGYANYKNEEKALRINFSRRVQLIKQLINEPKLLDAGAGMGFFVSEARNAGIKAFGLEVSRESVKYANKNFGLYFESGAIENYRKNIKFDVVTAWDVIEHVQNPMLFLKKINKLLKDGGYFIFTTGDVRSLASKISKERWHLFNLPEHLYFYSPSTITRILEKRGFEVLSIMYPANYYSLAYIWERFSKKYLRIDYKIKAQFMNKINIPVNLWDIMEVRARKKPTKMQ